MSSSILKVLIDILDNRKFSVKDTALTYKLINDWDAKDIINLKQVNEGWRTFSLVELV